MKTGIEQLVPGSMWTISPNNSRKDNSWVGDILEVISIAGLTVFLQHRWSANRNYNFVINVQFNDHDWFQAENLLLELQRHEKEAKDDTKQE